MAVTPEVGTDLMRDRVVLITGAGAGVGRGLALASAAAGAHVVVTARRSQAGQEVVAEIGNRGGSAMFVPCDVTLPDHIPTAISAAVDRFGGLDAFVHNATSRRSSESVDLEHADVALWEEHASVSVRAVFRAAQASYKELSRAGGSLLVLTSPAGMGASAPRSFYSAVKGVQRGFVKSLAREWGPDNIRVNGLAPLAVTPALDRMSQEDPDRRAQLDRIVPLGRVGDPETDIGPPAVFLCSDAARYITGQTLVVSGGRLTAL